MARAPSISVDRSLLGKLLRCAVVLTSLAGCGENRPMQAVWAMPQMPQGAAEPRSGGPGMPHGVPWRYAQVGGDAVAGENDLPYGELPETALFDHGDMWRNDERLAFAEARDTGRGVLIDFWAMWCIPCMRMEAETFRDPEVQVRINAAFVPLKVDVTEETRDNRQQLERYDVAKLPVIVLLDAQGRELARVDEFLGPSEFLERLAQVKP